MNKYVVIAFAVLGAWFYEASGGPDFAPGSNGLVVFADPQPITTKSEPQIERVARADTSGAALTDISEARDAEAPVSGSTTSGLSIARMEPIAVTEPEPEPAVVQEPASAPQLAVTEPDPIPDTVPDLRFVEGDSVNLRGGPGTDYAVVGRLVRNDMVEVLKDEGDGWLHLRVSDTGEEGWMADWLVTAAN